MPTYEYKCDACGHAFEKFQSIMAPAIRKCPNCGKLKVRRLIGTGSGVIFKGSGFYTTDYRSEAYKDAAKSDSAAKTGGGDSKIETPAASGGATAAPAADGAKPADARKSGDAKPAEAKTPPTPAPKPVESKPAEPSKSSSKSKPSREK